MRRSDMRNRLMVSVAVLAFGMAGLGLAMVAARSGDGGGLPKLPFAAAGARAEAADAAAMMAPAGRIEYRVQGELPALPREAAAYRLAHEDGADAARGIAGVLGMDGSVERRDGAWRVRDGERELMVHDQPGMPWNLGVACPSPTCPDGGGVDGSLGTVSSGSSGSSGSAGAEVEAREAEAGSGGGTVGHAEPGSPPDGAEPARPDDGREPAPPPSDAPTVYCIRPEPPVECPDTADCVAVMSRCATTPVPSPPVRPADLPDREAAERQARELLDRLGLDVQRLDVSDGITSWWVNARILVDGVPVLGYDANVSIGPKGVVETAHGWAGTPDRIGDYPLVGTDEGLDRLREGVGIGPRPLEDMAIGAPDLADCTKETVICDPVGGGPEPGGEPEPVVVTITDAHLALQMVGDVLVPVYVFEVEDGQGEGPMVPAVVDELLKDMDGDPEPGPVDEPEPREGEHACSAAAAAATGEDGAADRDAPLTVEVCGPATAKVGEEVVFEVTVTDPDAQIVEEGCGGPHVFFGDEDGAVTADCMPACAAPVPDGKGPGKLHRTFRHTYAKAGTYTARFTFQSEMCTKGWSRGESEHTVRVAE